MRRGSVFGARGSGLFGGLLALACSASALAAQDGGLHASVDSARVRVGDPVTIRLRADLGPGAELIDRVPRMRDTLPDGVRLLAVDSIAGGGGRVEGAMRFVVLRTGTRVVPPLVVSYRTSGGAVDSVVSAPVSIEVASVLAGPSEAIRDIKDIARSALRRWLRVGGGVVLLALLVAGAALLRRRLHRRSHEHTSLIVPAKRSPYERAIDELGLVAAAGWPARGDVVRHFAAVADVLRRYLEEAARVPALERTTPELIRILPSPLSDAALRDRLRQLLGEADLVKFALVRPSEGDATAYLASARQLLDDWQPTLEVASVAGEGNAVR